MADEHIGALVAVECVNGTGSYQGVISFVDADTQTVTLRNPFLNGKQLDLFEFTINGSDMKDLKILQLPTDGGCAAVTASTSTSSTISRRQQKRASSVVGGGGEDVATNGYQHVDDPYVYEYGPSPTVCLDEQTKDSLAPTNGHRMISPSDLGLKMEWGGAPPTTTSDDLTASTMTANGKHRRINNAAEQNHRRPVSAAFKSYNNRNNGALANPCGDPIMDRVLNPNYDTMSNSGEFGGGLGCSLDRHLMATDFDFEANLALFDKPKLFDDGEPSTRQRGRSVSGGGNPTATTQQARRNYRHDENIVADPANVYSWTTAANAAKATAVPPPATGCRSTFYVTTATGRVPIPIVTEECKTTMFEQTLTTDRHRARIGSALASAAFLCITSSYFNSECGVCVIVHNDSVVSETAADALSTLLSNRRVAVTVVCRRPADTLLPVALQPLKPDLVVDLYDVCRSTPADGKATEAPPTCWARWMAMHRVLAVEPNSATADVDNDGEATTTAIFCCAITKLSRLAARYDDIFICDVGISFDSVVQCFAAANRQLSTATLTSIFDSALVVKAEKT